MPDFRRDAAVFFQNVTDRMDDFPQDRVWETPTPDRHQAYVEAGLAALLGIGHAVLDVAAAIRERDTPGDRKILRLPGDVL